MKTTLFKTLALSTLCTLLGASTVLSAPGISRVQGTLHGKLTFAPTNITGGTYAVKVQSTGALSHLGRSAVVWEGDIALDSNLQPTALAGLGWRLRSAQGSTLRGTVLWSAHATNSPGVYTLRGTLQTTSGTGRLEGATGRGTVIGKLNALTGRATLHVDARLKTVWRRGRSGH